MKLSKFPAGVALCATTSLLLISCQKDESFYNIITDAKSNISVSDVAKDDSVLLNIPNIPTNICLALLKQNKDFSFNILFIKVDIPNGRNGIISLFAGNANQDYRPSASYPVHQKFYSSLYI